MSPNLKEGQELEPRFALEADISHFTESVGALDRLN